MIAAAKEQNRLQEQAELTASGEELMRGAKCRMRARAQVALNAALQSECLMVTKFTQRPSLPPYDQAWPKGSVMEEEYIAANKHGTLSPEDVPGESPLIALWRCSRRRGRGDSTCGHVWLATCFNRSNRAVQNTKGQNCPQCAPSRSQAAY